MENISQTKEGFIKSMVLFVVLLGMCFAPFFAFSQNEVKKENQINPSSIEKTTAHSAVVSEAAVKLELSKDNRLLNLSFQTNFRCTSYVLEGRLSEDAEFTGVSYCNSERCADAASVVTYQLTASELNYTQFRVKATNSEGQVFYSETRNHEPILAKEVELINSAANDQLFLKYNAATAYSYSISSINGEIIKYDEPVSGNSIRLSGIEAGFYIISFKGTNGNVYHYKFFKTINL